MVKKVILVMIGVSLFLLGGCSKEETVVTESIEQIQEREGVPVRVREVAKEEYSQELAFSGKIKPLKESIVNSAIAGRVESIVNDVNDRVKENEVVIKVPTDVPASQYNQTKEAYELAENTYNRMLELFKSGAISQQDLDQTAVQYQVAKSNFESINKILNIESPIDGIISIMYAEVGDVINPGTQLFQVADNSRYKARIYVPESQIAEIKRGQNVTASWNQISIEGKISKVSQALDPATNAFIVDVLFPTVDSRIKLGVTVDLKVEVYKTIGIAIESQYVLTEGNEKYVFVKDADKASKRLVKIAKSLNGKVEIADGLKEGDILITQGSNYVSHNALIKIVD